MKKQHQLIDTLTRCNYEWGRDARFPTGTQKHTSKCVAVSFQVVSEACLERYFTKHLWNSFLEIFLRDSWCKNITVVIFMAASVGVIVNTKQDYPTWQPSSCISFSSAWPVLNFKSSVACQRRVEGMCFRLWKKSPWWSFTDVLSNRSFFGTRALAPKVITLKAPDSLGVTCPGTVA